MDISTETIQTQLPYYLTQEQKHNLVKALNEFPKINFYTERYPLDILQGDSWTNLDVISFEDGSRKKIRGIILSNSCDISLENERDLPPKLIFAPIIKLNNFAELIKKCGVLPSRISSRLHAIREQKVTTMFYLPKGGNLDDEYVAVLDDLHTIPLNAFVNDNTRKKLFTLSQAGFYLFLLKLSVHFCRFHENLSRC